MKVPSNDVLEIRSGLKLGRNYWKSKYLLFRPKEKCFSQTSLQTLRHFLLLFFRLQYPLSQTREKGILGFRFYVAITCPTGSGTIFIDAKRFKFWTHFESKVSQCEIVVARFNTQLKVNISLKLLLAMTV